MLGILVLWYGFRKIVVRLEKILEINIPQLILFASVPVPEWGHICLCLFKVNIEYTVEMTVLVYRRDKTTLQGHY